MSLAKLPTPTKPSPVKEYKDEIEKLKKVYFFLCNVHSVSNERNLLINIICNYYFFQQKKFVALSVSLEGYKLLCFDQVQHKLQFFIFVW